MRIAMQAYVSALPRNPFCELVMHLSTALTVVRLQESVLYEVNLDTHVSCMCQLRGSDHVKETNAAVWMWVCSIHVSNTVAAADLHP